MGPSLPRALVYALLPVLPAIMLLSTGEPAVRPVTAVPLAAVAAIGLWLALTGSGPGVPWARRVDGVLAAASGVCATHLLLKAGFPRGHDVSTHLWGLYGFYHAVLEGDLFPRWIHQIGAGMPLLMFYPPAPFYGALPFLALPIPVYDALKYTLVLFNALSGLAMYHVALCWTMDRRAALVAAGVYCFAPYHLLQSHYRVGIAEAAAMAVLPFFFFHVDRLVRDPGPDRPWVLAIVWTGVLALTHPLSLIMAAVGAVFWTAAAVLYPTGPDAAASSRPASIASASASDPAGTAAARDSDPARTAAAHPSDPAATAAAHPSDPVDPVPAPSSEPAGVGEVPRWRPAARAVVRLAAVVGLGMALAGFYVVPAAIESRYTSVDASIGADDTTLYRWHGLRPAQLIQRRAWTRWQQSEARGEPGDDDEMPFYFGLSLLAMVPLALFRAAGRENRMGVDGVDAGSDRSDRSGQPPGAPGPMTPPVVLGLIGYGSSLPGSPAPIGLVGSGPARGAGAPALGPANGHQTNGNQEASSAAVGTRVSDAVPREASGSNRSGRFAGAHPVAMRLAALTVGTLILSLYPFDVLLAGLRPFALLQFPWRFLGIATFGAAALSAFAVCRLDEDPRPISPRVRRAIPGIVLALCVIDALPYAGAPLWEPPYRGIYHLTGGEALPSPLPFLRVHNLPFPPSDPRIDLSAIWRVYPEYLTPAVRKRVDAEAVPEALAAASVAVAFDGQGHATRLDPAPYAAFWPDSATARAARQASPTTAAPAGALAAPAPTAVVGVLAAPAPAAVVGTAASSSSEAASGTAASPAPASASGAAAPPPAAAVRALAYTRGGGRISVTLTGEGGRLELKEQWFPGWEASRPGNPAPVAIEPTPDGFMAIRIGEGWTGPLELRFTGARWDRRAGVLLSGAVLAGLVISRVRRKRAAGSRRL